MDLGGKGAIKAIGSRIGAWFEDQDQQAEVGLMLKHICGLFLLGRIAWNKVEFYDITTTPTTTAMIKHARGLHYYSL